MLKRRAVHKDMAEANVYAARRLKDMAQSLGGLAKTFGRCREEPGLSREDGIAALEAASAMASGNSTALACCCQVAKRSSVFPAE